MNRKIAGTILFSLLLVFLSRSGAFAQEGGDPWSQKDLLDPGVLANMMSDPKSEKPVIYNIGPLSNIKGAVKIGPTREKANLDKLRKALTQVKSDRMVVIYCGCCPFRNCPNVRPAFSLLKEMKFTKARLLNLPQNLKTDWMDHGYPME